MPYTHQNRRTASHPAGEGRTPPLRVDFDRRLKLEFHGSKITSTGGVFVYRELDDALGHTGSTGPRNDFWADWPMLKVFFSWLCFSSEFQLLGLPMSPLGTERQCCWPPFPSAVEGKAAAQDTDTERVLLTQLRH